MHVQLENEQSRREVIVANQEQMDRKKAVLIIDIQNRSRMTMKHPQRDEEIDEEID